MDKKLINELTQIVEKEWANAKQGKFWNVILNKPVSRELYQKLMIEIYHYTKHNSMNQAVASFVAAPEGLLKFVYQHAYEELGHERMVTHDLEAIGLLDKVKLYQNPLPATEALTGYLYYVALKYGAVARLGYSFWAESVYSHIDELIQKIRTDLNLTNKEMSFFVAHSRIDTKHFQEVSEAIINFAVTDEQKSLIKQVTKTTMFLTFQMLEQVLSDTN
jgi:pyrroloquinoline quinone (PQQ) biosynthesis protein C